MSYAEAKYIITQLDTKIEARAGFTHSKLFTSNSTFVVPSGITKLCISACAAGGAPEAGEFVLNEEYTVTPGQSMEIIVGAGNTVIGTLRTLIAASINYSLPNNKLGFMHGYSGGWNKDSNYFKGGAGGAFGFGGGIANNGSNTYGGSGAGVSGTGLHGGAYSQGGNSPTSASLVSVLDKTETGGAGCSNSNTITNAKGIITNPSVGGKAGAGTLYGGGGGDIDGNGGSAGGFGAGGGYKYETVSRPDVLSGRGSNGMILIEW